MMEEVRELKNREWNPRLKVHTPKTLNEIKEDATNEETSTRSYFSPTIVEEGRGDYVRNHSSPFDAMNRNAAATKHRIEAYANTKAMFTGTLLPQLGNEFYFRPTKATWVASVVSGKVG